MNHPVSPWQTVVDQHTVEWSRVRRASYRLNQWLRYEYPGPITNLRQRLMLIPRAQHGGQRLLHHQLEVTPNGVAIRDELDVFGNRVLWVEVPHVHDQIEFEATIELERIAGYEGARVPAALAQRYLTFTSLTAPDAALRQVAHRLTWESDGPSYKLASRINAWVYRAMRYQHGITHVGTTAADALDGGVGVCQDYAHVMLALCRLCDIPARYVSGHLLGEGGTHAWVEVLLPSFDQADTLLCHAYDPTHGRRAGVNYITVATGRDYADVAPTTGSYVAPYVGSLHTRKHAMITGIEYAQSPWQ